LPSFLWKNGLPLRFTFVQAPLNYMFDIAKNEKLSGGSPGPVPLKRKN